MKINELREDWHEVSALLDEALELPDAQRSAWIDSLCGAEQKYRQVLSDLLVVPHDSEAAPALINLLPGFKLPGGAPADDGDDGPVLGQLIGPYRLLALLGRGGMGTVWLAERDDAQPRRKIALKLPHLGWALGLRSRLRRERDILATLEHPNIARLYEAGVDLHGRPYLALEYVDGVPIAEYCERHRLTLRQRVQLLLLVAAAVSYAHTRLVVHRDLKPSNILVTASGDPRLLDFGIAKLLQDDIDSDDVTRLTGRALTPDYSSPEQILGKPIGTASDVYSLGVVAYELLAKVRPYRLQGAPESGLSEAMASLRIALPSRAARDPAVQQQLRGDLDAILNQALKKDPAERYQTVAAFAEDLQRYLDNRPVSARRDTLAYRSRKFVARYSLQVGAAAVVIAAIVAGGAAALWQAHQAHVEAGHATATRNFLFSVFRASDPRIASDKPRGEITAKELLNVGSMRIESEFAGQPELQIELLGLAAEIYNNLSDDDRYEAVEKRRIQLARAYYGSTHPIVIAALIREADIACGRQDYARANQLLDETDASLTSSGQNVSVMRANWWRTKARVFGAAVSGEAERSNALNQALALYAQLAPHSNDYASGLSMASTDLSAHGDNVRAEALMKQALAVAESAPDRDDSSLADLLINLARKQERLGEFGPAEATYQRAEDMARSTYGTRHPYYWLALAYHAHMLHLRGDRKQANALFQQMLASIPLDWKSNIYDKWVRETYAEALVADGRAQESVPLFEAAYQHYLVHSAYSYDVREIRRKLGDAYDRVGRLDDARALLGAARDEYLAQEAPDSAWALRVRERWARFLLDHSNPKDADFAAAESELIAVLDKVGTRPMVEAALAHSGLARIHLAKGDAHGALEESVQALAALDRVQGLYDVRVGPAVWLVHSDLLLRSGDTPSAQSWAQKALQADLRYDEPDSAAIVKARAVVAATTSALRD